MPEEFEDVTVITTTYESSIYIDKCLQSVISQTIKPKEIIIVDDNSSDQKLLKKKIEKFKIDFFPNIKFIVNKENLGPGYSRNLAWSKCTTQFIAFLDDDDIWYNDKLKVQLDIFKKYKNTQLVACKKKMLNQYSIFNERNFPNIKKISFLKLLFKNYIPTSSVLMKSDLKERFLNKYRAEDYYLWLSILKKKSECYLINDFLCEEIRFENRLKLSNDNNKIYKAVQNVLNKFYSDNLINNLLVSFAKLYYYFKMIVKIII